MISVSPLTPESCWCREQEEEEVGSEEGRGQDQLQQEEVRCTEVPAEVGSPGNVLPVRSDHGKVQQVDQVQVPDLQGDPEEVPGEGQDTGRTVLVDIGRGREEDGC